MLAGLDALPDALDDVETLLADSGYAGAAYVNACAVAGIAPLIATGRHGHHQPLTEG